MGHLTELPLEIFDQIISDISKGSRKSLANLSQTCKHLYHRTIPHLYRVLEIRFTGRPSWKSRTEILEALAPPSSYRLPRYIDSEEDTTQIHRKGKSVAGRSRGKGKESGASSTAFQVDSDKLRLPLIYIKEISIHGYWLNEKEQSADEYWHSHHGDMREHQPFLNALEGLIWCLKSLEGFEWKIAKYIPPRLNLAISRFETLRLITICGDTHTYCSQTNYPSYGSPTPLTNDPLFFSNNSLETIRALQTGDYGQVIHYGDIIRSPTNWKSLRHFEFDVSSGFISTTTELEPLEPDLLSALFRPPPPPPGSMRSEKLKLHSFKLRDVAFQVKGINAILASIEASELRDLDLYYCQDGLDLLKNWSKNKLKNLERLYIKEELSLPALCKFLRQFGPGGTCRKLSALELCCWHVDRWNMFDPIYGTGSVSYGLGHDPYDDTDSEFTSEGSDGDVGYSELGLYENDDGDDDSDSLMTTTTTNSDDNVILQAPKNKCSLLQPWGTIQDLRGSKDEGWGLERLILDMRPGASLMSGRLPYQESFLDGFWKLRELALPLCYDNERWKRFVDTVCRLPSLEVLFLLNSRTEPRSGGNYVHFNTFQPPFTMSGVYPPTSSAPITYQQYAYRPKMRYSKNREKEITDQPDIIYQDALLIAGKNRLFVHSTSISKASGSPSSASSVSMASEQAWRGKLEYIGIRSACADGHISMNRVWKVQVKSAPEIQSTVVLEACLERRKTLRSNTRKRKFVPEKDWRVFEEGGQICRLEEVHGEHQKKALANGLFLGMLRTNDQVHQNYHY